MNRRLYIIPLVALCMASCAGEPGVTPLDYVDPYIGGVGVLLQPTRPTVQIPNRMVRWTPARADLLDDQISDFPLTLTSHRLSSVFGFLPAGPDVSIDDVWSLRQEYDHEHVTPYSYDVRLGDCTLDYSVTDHCGIARIDFDSPQGGLLRLRLLGDGQGWLSPDGFSAMCGCDSFSGMSAYAYMKMDCSASDLVMSPDGRQAAVKVPSKSVTVKYGISYVSADQAKANLEKEIPDFDLDKVRSAAREAWADALGLIEVEGGTERDLKLFYTSLYRCRERMVDISEYGRYYSAFDHSVHESDRPFYTDNWTWDTHVSLEPLITILDPEMEQDKLDSYVEMYKQCGVVPSFATIWGDWAAMTGNYAAVWMADSKAKGLEFDLEGIYDGLRKNSLEETLLPWANGPRTSLDNFYDEHGWYPALHPGEAETVPEVQMPWERRQSVSLATAFSYADWAMGQLARSLGNDEDAAIFDRRADFWRVNYRPDKGMFWPRDEKGEWIEGVDPRYMDRAYYTENNAYTFQWDVKHNLDGLFEVMGGKAEAEKKLDDLFRIQNDIAKFKFFDILPDATGMVGQFAMGNEPSFHIPYIYDYLGSPWKTQKRIHQLIEFLFNDSVTGIPGDEDGGGMSSFAVFSMMGFFPVTPGMPVYAIGSPFFEKTTIHLPSGGTFTVKALNYSQENKYIQSAKLSGEPLDKPFFTHDQLMAGGTLELVMGPDPKKDWGM